MEKLTLSFRIGKVLEYLEWIFSQIDLPIVMFELWASCCFEFHFNLILKWVNLKRTDTKEWLSRKSNISSEMIHSVFKNTFPVSWVYWINQKVWDPWWMNDWHLNSASVTHSSFSSQVYSVRIWGHHHSNHRCDQFFFFFWFVFCFYLSTLFLRQYVGY